MTISLWQRAALPTEHECDLAIVGAGIAGLAAAIEARASGLRVVVLERGGVGAGASGRNAGYLIRGAADNYAAAAKAWGRTRAADIWRLTEENHSYLHDLGLAATGGYRRIGSCVVAIETGELAELEESADLMREDGFEVSWASPGSIEDSFWRAGRALGGLVNPGDAVCDPAALLAILRASLGDGGTLLVGEEVFGCEEAAGGRVAFRSTTCRVVCDRALLCTNAYAGLLAPALAGVVVPRRAQMLQLVSPGASLAHAYYANHGSEYFRPGPEGTILLGGCRTRFAEAEVGFEDVTTTPVQAALERFAAEVIGVRGRVVARWSGTMGFSPDGMPLVGPVEVGAAPRGRVWFCGGFTGHGMSMAYSVARGAVRTMLEGGENAFALSRIAPVPGAET